MTTPLSLRAYAGKRTQGLLALASLSALAAWPLTAAGTDTTAKVDPDEQAIELTPFTVTSDKDVGFVAASAQAGGRLATDLKDTPVAYSVINQELIQALGITDLTQAAEWTTNSFRFPDGAGGGDTFNITTPVAVRGILGSNPLRQRNFFIYFSENDSYNIERFDFGRGPNQILFGNGTVGGMQVAMTKRPKFNKSFETYALTLGSWNSRRVTVDVNRKLSNQVALRADAVASKRDGWRAGEMENRIAGFLTGSYRPFRNTELRLEGELGETRRRTPYSNLTDKFGGWNGVYSGGYLTSLPSNSGALGIDRRASNYFVYNPTSGDANTVYNLTNWAMTRGAGDTTTTPSGSYYQVGTTSWNQSGASILHAVDVVPERFDTAIAHSYFRVPDESFTNAPRVPLITSKYKDIQGTLSQQVGDNLFLEVAGDINKVNSRINRTETDSIATYIDINPTLPGGSSNPNYLQPYGDGRFWYNDKITEAQSVRAAAAYVLDLKNWGTYSFNLMGGLTHQRVGNYNWVLSPGVSLGQLVDIRQWGNLSNGIRQRYYWNDTHSYVEPVGQKTFIANDGTVMTSNPTWMPAIGDSSENNFSINDNNYNFLMLAGNAKLFKGRWILLGAARYDDSKQHVKYLVRQGDFPSTWDGSTLYWRPDAPSDWASLMYTPVGSSTPVYAITRPRTTNSYGVAVANSAYSNVRFADDYNPPAVTFKGWTPSTGSVLHLTNWWSLSANYSKAISFNTSAAPDVYGRLLPTVTGKGWDIGTRFSLLHNRLNFSAGMYRNGEYGNYVDPTSVTNQINTLYQANVYGDTTTGGRNQQNATDINGLVRDTRTRVARGYEFEMVANLTKNWRLTANYAIPKVMESQYAPMTRAYCAANADLFKTILSDAGGMVNSSGIAVLKPGITDTGTAGSESTGNEAARAVAAYNAIYTNLANFVVNQRPTTSNPNTLNVFTDYTFSTGKLKGLKGGIGANWRGRRIVGYRGGDTIAQTSTTAVDDPTVDGYTPIYAPGSIMWTGTLGYKWKLEHNREISVNLVINNLLNNRNIVWTDTTTTLRPKGGDFTSPARETVYNPYAYQVPRNFSLTMTVGF